MLKKVKPERQKLPHSSSESEEDSEEEERERGACNVLIKEDRNKFHTFGKEQFIGRIDEEQEDEESSSYDGNREEGRDGDDLSNNED